MGEEEGGLGHGDLQILLGAGLEDLLHGGHLLVAKVGDHLPEPLAKVGELDALLEGEPGFVLDLNGQENDPFVQDLVVFEVVQHGVGYHLHRLGEKHGGAGDLKRRVRLHVVNKPLQRQ